jgi:hypothetical protein
MTAVAWDHVAHDDVERAIQEYDRLGPEEFFSKHGFGPTTTYDLIWEERRYPPKAILGTAYELATGQRLAPGDFARPQKPVLISYHDILSRGGPRISGVVGTTLFLL